LLLLLLALIVAAAAATAASAVCAVLLLCTERHMAELTVITAAVDTTVIRQRRLVRWVVDVVDVVAAAVHGL
jgi:spore maturation protein SpmB